MRRKVLPPLVVQPSRIIESLYKQVLNKNYLTQAIVVANFCAVDLPIFQGGYISCEMYLHNYQTISQINCFAPLFPSLPPSLAISILVRVESSIATVDHR
jgi:hypothetical protein